MKKLSEEQHDRFLVHDIIRNLHMWCSNSVEPVRNYYIAELSTPHILNIIRNVDHLSDEYLKIMKTEIEGRCLGIYENIEEYHEEPEEEVVIAQVEVMCVFNFSNIGERDEE